MEGRPLDETELVERAKQGDEVAYGDLVQAYQGIAFRTAYLIAGSAADAEDAAQEGFVKAWSALHRFRAGAPFRPWILQIVANEARNRRRAAGRRAHLTLRTVAATPSGEAAPSPEDTALDEVRHRSRRRTGNARSAAACCRRARSRSRRTRG